MTLSKIVYYSRHPQRALLIIKRRMSVIQRKYMIPRRCFCSFCGKYFHQFAIHGYDSELSRIHETTMGFRESDCPFCGSIDKHRWIWEVIEEEIKEFGKLHRIKVLHFAPEESIKKRLMGCAEFQIDYLSGDIVEGRADMIVDMTDIPFENETFDLIVASQVLEHIPNEKKALEELKRVLKRTGKVILSIPCDFELDETKEDLTLGEKERQRQYGQYDHVRLYGMDYKERISALSGMRAKSMLPKDKYNPKDIQKLGLKKAPPVLVLEKEI